MKRIFVFVALFCAVFLAQSVDFRLSDRSGADFRLSDVQSEYVLLFLYNSDCDACVKAASDIAGSELMSSLPPERLAIVSIALFDDGRHWKQKAETFPHSWIHAFDKYDDIIFGDALEFSTVPVYVLLGSEREVLFCGCSFRAVESHLKSRLAAEP